MMTTPAFSRGFSTFLHGMVKGPENLDDMLKDVYLGTREQFLTLTGEWVAERYGNNDQ